MAPSIVVENLSKQYRIGRLSHETMLREALVNLIKHPIRRLRTKRETIWALKDVSFEVQEGEVVGIIGRNGAGKSTLLKLLSKITYPTTGSVKTTGNIASLLEVGTGFHEELTGRENIYLNGSILGMKKREIDSKLDAIVQFADVAKFIDTPIKRFSSGMRLRLGFAVAAHLDPDVLLVDEVLAVGDAGFQKKCLDTMDDMHSGGRTVLFVSHNMSAVENLCPRVIWIDNGRIEEDGPAQEVIRHYMSSFAGAQRTGHNLSNIEARRGSGEIKYTGIEFLDFNRKAKDLIRSGDSLVVRLHYKAERQVQKPHFGFEVHTDLGTMITSLNTWSTGFEISALRPGQGYIDLEVSSLNLMPDRYYISLWLARPGPGHYDRLDHCAIMDIESSDYYHTGRGIERRFGIIFFPCQWRLPEAQDYGPCDSGDAEERDSEDRLH